MEIFPAIDLRGGQVVRLKQGDPNAQTTFSDSPTAMAQQWVRQGARWLHIVNLDGAFTGDTPFVQLGRPHANLDALRDILQTVDVPVQFGGGLRDLPSIAYVIGLGAARVIIGTAAVKKPQLVSEAIATFGAEKIVVGLDAKEGAVATHGWQEMSALRVGEVALRMKTLGVQRVVFTDISRDGMLQGVNAAATYQLAKDSDLKIIASGGVASLGDIRQLKAAECEGVEGVIVGQALYTGAINLPEAIKIADGKL
jgi:phosphoribosylformimino-5-aminoimidazole carboxamide ribotide isomerase